jgi:hypothetical protein
VLELLAAIENAALSGDVHAVLALVNDALSASGATSKAEPAPRPAPSTE